MNQIDTAAVADTVPADTLVAVRHYGVILTPPKVPEVEPKETTGWDISFVIGGIVLLFCIIGLRFHNNRKYVTSLVRNLVDVRVRNNVFDETVKETSFIVLLNLLWCCSAGILLYAVLAGTQPANPAASFGIPGIRNNPAGAMAICMGVAVMYTGFMALAYFLVGAVFTDRGKARLWVKGYVAGQGFLSFIYFILALLFISHPEWVEQLLWVAVVALVLMKIVFIWKGFRIFFTQISSWVLFLYYLCSLEIVPLILTYLAAILLCGFLP